MKKILVIEDEPETLENLVLMLEMEGFKPLSAANGCAGVVLAKREIPDVPGIARARIVPVDMTPGSPGERLDSVLPIGRTFSDELAGVLITPKIQGEVENGKWVDVDVHFFKSNLRAAPGGFMHSKHLPSWRIGP